MLTALKNKLVGKKTVEAVSPPAVPGSSSRGAVIEGLENRVLLSTVPPLIYDGLSAFNDFGVFGMSGSKMDITNPQTRIGGDVGIGPNGVQNFSDGLIDASLIVDPTANNSHNNNVKNTTTGQKVTVVTKDLSATNAALVNLSSAVAALTPTQTLGNISGNTVINSSGNHINVIDVNSLTLNGSSTLTLNGGLNDYFFINVTGNFAMTGSSKIVANIPISSPGFAAFPSSHVFFNIVGTGQQVAFTGSSVGTGTFLAVDRDIAVSGATIKGVIAGAMNHKIAITSGAQVQVHEAHFDYFKLADPGIWDLP